MYRYIYRYPVSKFYKDASVVENYPWTSVLSCWVLMTLHNLSEKLRISSLVKDLTTQNMTILDIFSFSTTFMMFPLIILLQSIFISLAKIQRFERILRYFYSLVISNSLMITWFLLFFFKMLSRYWSYFQLWGLSFGVRQWAFETLNLYVLKFLDYL